MAKGKRFNFKNNGYGHVAEEARASFQGWSAVIQLLEFEEPEHSNDKFQLRFGYLDADGKLIARPLYLDDKHLAELGRQASQNQEIKKWLKPFFEAFK